MTIEQFESGLNPHRPEKTEEPASGRRCSCKSKSLFKASTISVIVTISFAQPVIGEESAQQTPSLPISSDPGSGLAKPSNFVRFAPSGAKQRIANVTLVNTDCSSMGVAVPRIIESPSYGKLEFENTDLLMNWNQGSQREKCSNKKYQSLLVIYTSDKKYIGADGAKVLMIYPDGTANEWDFVIAVR